METFEVKDLGPTWAVIFDGQVFSRWPTSAAAIKAGVDAAAQYAATGHPARVTIQEEAGGQRVLWTSTTDGFVGDS